jgi:hypothetical protein
VGTINSESGGVAGIKKGRDRESEWTRSKGIGKFKRTWAYAKEYRVEWCGGVEGGGDLGKRRGEWRLGEGLEVNG